MASLPHIAQHVIQAPGVRQFLTHLMWHVVAIRLVPDDYIQIRCILGRLRQSPKYAGATIFQGLTLPAQGRTEFLPITLELLRLVPEHWRVFQVIGTFQLGVLVEATLMHHLRSLSMGLAVCDGPSMVPAFIYCLGEVVRHGAVEVPSEASIPAHLLGLAAAK